MQHCLHAAAVPPHYRQKALIEVALHALQQREILLRVEEFLRTLLREAFPNVFRSRGGNSCEHSVAASRRFGRGELADLKARIKVTEQRLLVPLHLDPRW